VRAEWQKTTDPHANVSVIVEINPPISPQNTKGRVGGGQEKKKGTSLVEHPLEGGGWEKTLIGKKELEGLTPVVVGAGKVRLKLDRRVLSEKKTVARKGTTFGVKGEVQRGRQLAANRRAT